jgi:A/G-specific adenine glycosylase
LPPVDHALTHFDWRLEPWRHALPARLAASRREAIEAALPAGRWCTRDEALAMALPAPVRRLIERY